MEIEQKEPIKPKKMEYTPNNAVFTCNPEVVHIVTYIVEIDKKDITKTEVFVRIEEAANLYGQFNKSKRDYEARPIKWITLNTNVRIKH